jgi:FlaA1/EpsC-like NDP-sugar epimerase
MMNWLNSARKHRHIRAIILALAFTMVLLAARFMAYLLRFDFIISKGELPTLFGNFLWQLPLKLLLLALFGQLYGILRYFSVPDFLKINFAMGLTAAITLIFRLFIQAHGDPRGIILLDFFFSVTAISSIRLAIRCYCERAFSDERRTKLLRVGIVGAGDVGANLAREMQGRRAMGMEPVVFLDDDKTKWRLNIHGVPVAGPPESLPKLKKKFELDKVVLAMPSATAQRVQELIKLFSSISLPYETVPSLQQLTTGEVSVSRIRPVQIEDLLGRAAVSLTQEETKKLITGKVVAVTGAGGSIGSELCRQILRYNPEELILIEQSEPSMFLIEQELIALGFGGVIRPKVADICDIERMRYIFSRYQPSVLFHAAAHKHVPLMEYQPGEAIKNNTFGTANLAKLALEFNFDRFILISTDKAINPTNVMGATKRMAEIFLQSFAAENPGRTRFMAVRFGNVLGSSGSVIPTFKKQIEAGGPVKVTHPDIQRYFMTIPEAVGLVLQAAVIGQGGEIFVLDMGKPVKIVDLARQMIELSGYVPDQDIKIEFTGLRPGEKLFEELSNTAENHIATTSFLQRSHGLYGSHLSLDLHRERLPTETRNQTVRSRIQTIPPVGFPPSNMPTKSGCRF